MEAIIIRTMSNICSTCTVQVRHVWSCLWLWADWERPGCRENRQRWRCSSYVNPVIGKSCMHVNNRSFHILQRGRRGREVLTEREREEKTRYRKNEEVKEGGREALVCNRQREQVILSKSFSNMELCWVKIVLWTFWQLKITMAALQHWQSPPLPPENVWDFTV